MKRAEVIAFLEDVEQHYPVNDWKSGDADLWPMVKRDLFFKWFTPDAKASATAVSKIGKGKKLLSSVLKWIGLNVRKSTPVDKWLIGAASHRVDWKGVFINRYYYPMSQQDEGLSYKRLEYGERQAKDYAFEEDITFLEEYLFAALFLTRCKKMPPLYMPEWEPIMRSAQKKLGIPLENYERELKKTLQTFWAYVNLLSLLMTKYPVKECVGLCYYSLSNFALHYVCNKNGIANCDLQHGGQGRLHPMYYYANPPHDGYNVVPQLFWCWDQSSAASIRSWVSHQQFHQLTVQGNPWIDFQLTQADPWEEKEKKIILYTLQENRLDEYIVNAIQQTPNTLEWWLRLHPRKQEAKANIKAQLAAAGVVNNVVIDKATTLPLPLILTHSAVHLSKYSGAVIEAAQLNTPSIINDPIGVVSFKAYIDAGEATALVAHDADKLLSLILKLTEK